MSFPYLKMGMPQITYLMYLATGMQPSEIYPLVFNSDTKEQGVSAQTVYQWRQRDYGELFVEAEAQILEDPLWFHRHIAVPLKLAAIDARDLEYILKLDKKKEFKGFSAKDKELILDEAGLRGGTTPPGERLKEILRSIPTIQVVHQQERPAIERRRSKKALPAPASEVIDVTPTVVEETKDAA